MYPTTMYEAKGQNYYYEEEKFLKDPFHLVEAELKEKNYQIGMHSHQFYEINIVTKGSGCHYIEQMSFPAKTGDVFVIPSDIRHGYYCGSQLEVFHLLVKREFFRRYREELEGCPGYQTMFEIEPFLRQKSKENFFLHLNFEELCEAQNELEGIIQKRQKGLYVLQTVTALNLICTLCIKMNQQYHGGERNKMNHHELIPIIEYVQKHLDQKLTIDELADRAAMSRSTFTRAFKKSFSISPMEYVLSRRIAKAAMLIQETNFSKSEIAQMCGFYDVSHMDKYLKEKKGEILSD